ncbi:uncharacterized protein LOC106877575 [Octopus bimaculoides]|uniref:ISXO2-like transposase domain-containing protein n=1 Tax=Octopus bimaculoides TaxID=37653 RepID=A0A0L8GDS8_OCTBM|nr:uncharacterized protein LOC106877575 [Octopus bimaculoides]|eukprot:XP_014782000.1 PREDICTED: uncharacterized protein LOC106877575 [Octopus bimaculoides]
MARRYRIVESVLSVDDITERHHNLREIIAITGNADSTNQFLASVGLIHNSMECCNQRMFLATRNTVSDGKMWRCPVCRQFRSIRRDSFFSDSHLPLTRLLELMYYWARIECKQSVVMSEVGIGPEAIVKWYNYFRDVCAMWCFDHPVQLGGEDVVVELLESKFMHRKHHRGSYREGHWVLGLVEQESLKSVLVPVENTSAATLLPIITRHVLPGTKIITDSWAAYNSLPDDFTVNHNVTFVDPNDASVSKNTVEGIWSQMKANYRRMHGTSDSLFSTYLHEFCWRRHNTSNTFMSFIKCIRQYYLV